MSKSILITTYHNAYLTHAGGEFESLICAESFKGLGYTVDFYGPYSQDLYNYQTIFHFSINSSGIELLEKIREAKNQIFLWPNLWLSSPDQISKDIFTRHINCADYVVFKSNAEKINLLQYFQIPEEKIIIIKNGIDRSFLQRLDCNIFSDLFGINNFALSMGIIEPIKNQHITIEIAKKLNIPLVLVGNYRDRDYYNFCKKIATKNIFFIESLIYKSDLSRSALQSCRFFIEPSNEPAGLSALTAGISKAKLVLAENSWGTELFGKYPAYVNTKDSIDVMCNKIISHEKNASLFPENYFDDYIIPNNFKEILDRL
jgi:glycosyltransferase involved in cell wall biosynthesis